jgi:hypothetical protein
VLAYSTDLARAVLAGSRALDAAYDEAKKAKQPLNVKVAAKTQRAVNTRRRMKRSAGDYNHEGPDAENPEPGDTPEVIRDRAYTRQTGEALRLAHENKLGPIDPKEVIRAAKAEITETHVQTARLKHTTQSAGQSHITSAPLPLHALSSIIASEARSAINFACALAQRRRIRWTRDRRKRL